MLEQELQRNGTAPNDLVGSAAHLVPFADEGREVRHAVVHEVLIIWATWITFAILRMLPRAESLKLLRSSSIFGLVGRVPSYLLPPTFPTDECQLIMLSQKKKNSWLLGKMFESGFPDASGREEG